MLDEFIHEIQSLLKGHFGTRCNRIAIHVESCWTARQPTTEIDMVSVIYWLGNEQQSLHSYGRKQTLNDLRDKIKPAFDPIMLGC